MLKDEIYPFSGALTLQIWAWYVLEPHPGGGGAIPVYGLDRYVLLDGVWFLGFPSGGGVTWVNFCWVRAAGLLEPLTDYSLLCGQV